MTPEELDALEALAAAATQPSDVVVQWNPFTHRAEAVVSREGYDFVEKAREAVPALIAALREARAEVERLKTECDAEKPKASTVVTFLFPSGQWGWFVTPGPLAASCATQATRREAEEAATKHAERAGWPAVNRFNCQAEALDLSTERDAAFARGVAAMREAAAQACRPILRSMVDRGDIAATIRALPDPEDR